MSSIRQKKYNASQETDLSDEILLGRSQAGDERAFEALVKRYQSPLLKYIRRILQDEDQQDDVLQDVLFKLYLSLPILQREIPLKPWLFRVAHNGCVNELRRLRRRPSVFLSELWDDEHNEFMLSNSFQDSQPLPEEIVEQLDLHDVLQEVIDELPPKYRSIVHLRFFGELSFPEIGQKLSMHPSTAKTYCHRSLKRLRSTLANCPSLALFSSHELHNEVRASSHKV